MNINEGGAKIKSWFFLPVVLLVAFLLRLWHLTSISLWHDEAFSVLMVEYPLKEMLYRLTLDVHPPLYYVTFYGWNQLFGNSLFSLRFFSVLFGILTLFGVWLLVKKLFNDKKLAIYAILIAAVNPFLILYSQEGRMYAFGLFLVIFANLFLVRAIKIREISDWFFFIILASGATYVHYYLLFSVFAMFLFLAYRAWQEQEEKRSYLIKSIALSVSFLTALYLPWVKHFLAQLSQVQDNYWIPKMSLWSVPNTFINLLTGGVVSIGEHNWWLGVILIGLIIFFLWRGIGYLAKISKPGSILISINFFTPLVLAILLSLKQSLYLDRYFIFIVPFYLIILVAGIYSLKPKSLKNAVMIVLAGSMLLSYLHYWQSSDIENRPGMAAAEDYLTINYDQGDKILVTSSFVYFTFDYYNQTEAKPYLYAPGELSHFSGTALLDEDDIVKSFNQFASSGDRIWLINTSGFGNFRPELPSDWHKISEKEFVDSNSVKGSIFIEEYKIFKEDLIGKVKYK
jgi:uncharacterized membrane protein